MACKACKLQYLNNASFTQYFLKLIRFEISEFSTETICTSFRQALTWDYLRCISIDAILFKWKNLHYFLFPLLLSRPKNELWRSRRNLAMCRCVLDNKSKLKINILLIPKSSGAASNLSMDWLLLLTRGKRMGICLSYE